MTPAASCVCHRPGVFVGVWLFLGLGLVTPGFTEDLVWHLRRRAPSATNAEAWQVVETPVAWPAGETAVVVCDMWDRHWCRGATARVAEMAPRMNLFLKGLRQAGALVIHCPSETLKAYEGTPQRALARAAPAGVTRAPIQPWCGRNAQREPRLPIDDTDGGCDDQPPCASGNPWSRQIETLEIHEGDAISDSAEVIHLLTHRRIRRVLILGVHLNMCVLGRPFGIRQLVAQGFDVVLVRDLTDTMYNSRRAPTVPHFTGTDLMVEHVEKFWCPTVTSVDFLGGLPFRFGADTRPRVVVLAGEDEYATADTLPQWLGTELLPGGCAGVVLHEAERDRGHFPALEQELAGADVLLLSVRRRALPVGQLEAIRRHLDSGRGLVGIRTSSHAFDVRGSPPAGRREWPEFDAAVLGGNYQGHYGAGPLTVLSVSAGAAEHPILSGIDPAGWNGHGSLYRASPLRDGAVVLLTGRIPQRNPEPVAWTHRYGARGARVFYTSLGHPDDFSDPRFRRLLLNGVRWAAGPEPSPRP